jgi:hypothetical protein
MSDLTQALFESVANALSESEGRDLSAKDVAALLENRHGVPSDYFWSVWDIEVGELADRFLKAEETLRDEGGC